MVTILKKYDKLFLKDKFPAVLPIENMRSFCKVTDDVSTRLFFILQLHLYSTYTDYSCRNLGLLFITIF